MEKNRHRHDTYWTIVWQQFRRHRLGLWSLRIVILFSLAGIYAPFLASSKPLFVNYDGQWYFPLFTHLFYRGFFTKRLDIFYNILMFTLPLFILSWHLKGNIRKFAIGSVVITHVVLFLYFSYGPVRNPASDPGLNRSRQEALQQRRSFIGDDPLVAPLLPGPDWSFDLAYMTPYAQLDVVLRDTLRRDQDERLQQYQGAYRAAAQKRWLAAQIVKKRTELVTSGTPTDQLPDTATLRDMILEEIPEEVINQATAMPTLWRVQLANEEREIARHSAIMNDLAPLYPEAKAALEPLIKECNQLAANMAEAGEEHCEEIQQASVRQRSKLAAKRQIVERYERAKDKLEYILERRSWIQEQSAGLKYRVMPLIRSFHWEDDAGGEQSLNQYIGSFERTRVNRKDLVSALIFGIRISLVVGMLAVTLALLIGVPIGSLAGYYGGKFDIIVSRMLEIWESMPTFFMLLLVVAITQSKSIFLVIAVIGLFGWTGFSRFIRGEVFKQRNLSYVEACHALGFRDSRIIFGHILPNAIPPLLTLLPFAVMGAITSEAGLSFLGLGEEGSCSWGVLMDEGRSAFPGESYLLWPPAILLTILLIAIALVGDALRDSLDPKLRKG